MLFKTLQLLAVSEYNSAGYKNLVRDMRFTTEVADAQTLRRIILPNCQTKKQRLAA